MFGAFGANKRLVVRATRDERQLQLAGSRRATGEVRRGDGGLVMQLAKGGRGGGDRERENVQTKAKISGRGGEWRGGANKRTGTILFIVAR